MNQSDYLDFKGSWSAYKSIQELCFDISIKYYEKLTFGKIVKNKQKTFTYNQYGIYTRII